ncbi:T9SS type A sorting domain-containing protein [Psychroserpens ponticola]|uniref:T9SS type A sorting domain-containing protein n=1 Tax=Psychroserpens ponticola TaxID=2932268 RepID=A0ABY7RZB4_9FLAO|nr:T9SS type A sorting domain-containing protein [Psychroserpens ponticola]WCO02501.1 T9SS type A sorting domain-containing protein [Psychroserpens ponticola]
MKIFYTLFLFFFSIALTQAQIVNIPDSELKLVLTSFNCVDIDNDGFPDADADTNDDGEIQVSEAEAVEYLILSGVIFDLTGLESFTNLKTFNAENADFYEIGFVGGIPQYTGIGILDLTFMSSVERILITTEYLTAIDVSGLTNLTHLQLFNVLYGSSQGVGVQPVPVNLQDCSNLLNLNMMNSLLDIDFCQVPTIEELNSFALDPSVGLINLNLNCLTNLRVLDISENQFDSLYLKNDSVIETFSGFSTFGNVLCVDDNQMELDSLGEMVNNFDTVTTTCEDADGSNVIFGFIDRNASTSGSEDCGTPTGSNDFVNPLRFNVMQNGESVSNFLPVNSGYYETPIGLDQGDYVVIPTVNFSDGYKVVPEQFNVSFATNNSEMFEQNLCMKPRVETVNGIEIKFFPYYYPPDPSLDRFDSYVVLTNTTNVNYTGSLRLNYDNNFTSPLDYDVFPDSESNGDTIWNSLTIDANDYIVIWLRIRYNSENDPDYPVIDGDQLVYDLFLTEQTNPTTESTESSFRLIQTINPDEEVLNVNDVSNQKPELDIYPNPSNEFINIEVNENILEITVFSMTGQLVNSVKYDQNNSKLIKMNISEFDQGIYFLSIKTSKSTFTEKIIKN